MTVKVGTFFIQFLVSTVAQRVHPFILPWVMDGCSFVSKRKTLLKLIPVCQLATRPRRVQQLADVIWIKGRTISKNNYASGNGRIKDPFVDHLSLGSCN